MGMVDGLAGWLLAAGCCCCLLLCTVHESAAVNFCLLQLMHVAYLPLAPGLREPTKHCLTSYFVAIHPTWT